MLIRLVEDDSQTCFGFWSVHDLESLLPCSDFNSCAMASREDARFVDPLMDVGTPREINLAFFSLIKLFSSIDAQKKSLTWDEKPELPSHLTGAGLQQVCQLVHLTTVLLFPLSEIIVLLLKGIVLP